MRATCTHAALTAALLCGAVAHASTELHVDGGRFADAAGRTVILRGVDVGGNSKVPPFRAITTPAQLDPLPGWGVNVLRLLFTWEAYEATSGSYDASYLGYISGLVDQAWQRGIYVIIDFHQDAFSRYALAGCGEGFPSWTLPPTVTPATPDNGANCADWGTRQLGDADEKAIWSAFFTDQYGARTKYLAMITNVAQAMASHPGVIGYDMINEPNGDEATQIAPLHALAAQAIRSVDPSAILFVSPAVLTSSGEQTMLPRPTFGNFAYAPHFYDSLLVVTGAWNGDSENGPFGLMRGKASEWGVPLFLGEFGSPPSAGKVGGYMDALYQQLDSSFASGAQWVYTPGWTAAAKDGWNSEDYSIVDDSGALRANFRARAYPQKVAGTPTRFTVTEGASGSLTLEWTHVPAAGMTELFVPAASLFGTATPFVSTTGGATCTLSGSKVTCGAPTAGPVSVTVAAQAPPSTTPPTSPKSSGKSCGLTGMEAVGILWLLQRRRRRRA
jgi:endoglycosylceramidase